MSQYCQYEFIDNSNCFIFRINNNQYFQLYSSYFQAYQKYQDQISLKFPQGLNFRVAKILNLKINQQSEVYSIHAQLYYDGYDDKRHLITLNNSPLCKKAIPLKNIYQDISRLDVLAIKAAFQGLIEIFHWSANFGFFLDPIIQNLLFREGETDMYIFIPDFQIISSFPQKLNREAFDTFRGQIYQNFTFSMFVCFIDNFISEIKEQDEDRKFYMEIKQKYEFQNHNFSQIMQISEKLLGVDYLFSNDFVKKKMIRYGLKQTQFLYQFQSNKMLKQQFLKYKAQEYEIIRSGQQQLADNLFNFFKEIQKSSGQSFDIPTPFGQLWIKDGNSLQYAFRKNWKQINTCQQLECKKVLPQNQNQDDSINMDISLISQINNNNFIYQSITQSGQLIEKDVKKFTIIYKIELLEKKQCYVIKSQIPEIIFGIDTADDISSFINFIQKEELSTNVYVDDSRKMTLYTTIVQGKQVELLEQVLKIMDVQQIYFYLALEFYSKNIYFGKQIKESKYRAFISELKNLLEDYDTDFQKQMKIIKEDKIYEF